MGLFPNSTKQTISAILVILLFISFLFFFFNYKYLYKLIFIFISKNKRIDISKVRNTRDGLFLFLLTVYLFCFCSTIYLCFYYETEENEEKEESVEKEGIHQNNLIISLIFFAVVILILFLFIDVFIDIYLRENVKGIGDICANKKIKDIVEDFLSGYNWIEDDRTIDIARSALNKFADIHLRKEMSGNIRGKLLKKTVDTIESRKFSSYGAGIINFIIVFLFIFLKI